MFQHGDTRKVEGFVTILASKSWNHSDEISLRETLVFGITEKSCYGRSVYVGESIEGENRV